MTLLFMRSCVVLLCIAFATIHPISHLHAQNSPASQNWTRLPGTAVDISINSDGQAYVVAPDGTPWRWDAEEQRWRKMSGDFVRISAAEGNRPWAVSSDGVVYRYNGLWWENKDTDVVDVAADTLGNVYIAKVDGALKKWNPLRSEWRQVDGTAYRIALDMTGNPWAVARDGRVRSFDGKDWITLPGRATDIAIGGNNAVVIVDAEGQIRMWDPARRSWRIVAGVNGAKATAAAPDGGPWAVIEGGAIMATTLLVAPEKIKTEKGRAPQSRAPQAVAPVENAPAAVASGVAATPISPPGAVPPPPAVAAPSSAPVPVPGIVSASDVSADATGNGSSQGASRTVAPSSGNDPVLDPATITTSEDITFTDTRQTAKVVSIGRDGSVFGLDAGGSIYRWSNSRRRFEDFPGTLVRIAVDADGNPWGISTLGRVFRHTGNLWKQIPGATGSDIAIGGDGSVVIADASGNLSKLNDTMTRFDRIPGQGISVAVAPDGTPWTIRSDGLVQRCDTSPCKIIRQRAKSISIGPDGSVYVVSDTQFLMRLAANGEDFEVVLTPGHIPESAAVGPNGFPWVVTKDTHVLASKFFDRDEQADRRIAASTAGDTTGSGNTAAVVDIPSDNAFTFSKNITFETFTTNLNTVDAMTVGQNDGFYIFGSPLSQGAKQLLKFNTKTKKFEQVSLSFSQDLIVFDVASDDSIWTNGNSSSSIYRLSSTGTVQRTYSVTSGNIRDLSIGSDGTVYVVIDDRLYHLKPGTNAFTKFNNDDVRKVAVGRAGDLWIADANNIVQQFTGTRFENRPLGQSTKIEDIGAGSDGSIYVTVLDGNAYVLKKWNATNSSFDKVNNINADKVDVLSDGRPWITDTNSNTDAKRAKD
ncbi:tectonin domain-containing protein [Thalassospira sp.]|uniref:tectonin domain-containing protein n=1 Tax=Thalassospira sp. TaxID=1912094 RepID=UPI00311D443D